MGSLFKYFDQLHLLDFARAWSRDELDRSSRIILLKKQSYAEGHSFRTNFATLLAMYIHDGVQSFIWGKHLKLFTSSSVKDPDVQFMQRELVSQKPSQAMDDVQGSVTGYQSPVFVETRPALNIL